MKKGLSKKVIKRIELIEGVDINDALELRYFTEKLSYRHLCKLWNISNHTIAKVFLHCNKEPRKGGEAVATQWINNPDRRKQAGENLSKINHSLALKGLHVRQGKTKENSQLIRNIAEKLKTSSSFNRPEVKAKAQARANITRKKHPERNPFLETPKTECEKIMWKFLAAKNIDFKFRFIIDGYFVNFYLPTYNLCIDIQGNNRFPLSYKRHKSILKNGYCIIYCITNFVKKAAFADLYNYISSLDSFCTTPSVLSNETVIWGTRNKFPFGEELNQISVKRVYVDSFHKLYVSTATD